jgi:DNA-binding SARP family transcriptional activator
LPSRLQLTLLGAAEAFVGGRRVAFRTRKSLALLAYLALEPGPHSREQLADLLWPDVDGMDARASLRTALNDLHHALGDLSEQVLPATRDTVVLRPDLVDLDVEALREAQQLLRRFADVSLRYQIELAVGRYRGSLLSGMFLPNTPEFESWLEAQRMHWRGVVAGLLNVLGRLQVEAGEPNAAVDTFERWTHEEPDQELAWRSLIELQLWRNDPVGARDAWNGYHRALAELNATPSEGMIRLHQQISESVPAFGQQLPAGSRGLDFGSSPFVGRAREWAQLVASYQRAREGHTEVIVLEGPSGVGKSRLISEFTAWARSGSDVLVGRAFDGLTDLPFAALLEALRPRMEAENAPDDLLGDLWLAELSRLLPELRERYPDLSVPPDDGLGRGRIFEAVSRLVIGLAQREPVVLWIDDAQRADTDTRDLIRYGLRRWNESGTPLLLILSATSGTPAANGFAEWFTGIAGEAPARRLWLDPLEPDDVRQLVGSLAGGDADNRDRVGEFSRWLADRTGGRPRRVVQELREMVERGVLHVRAAGDDRWMIEPPVVAALPEFNFVGVGG